MNKVVIKTTPPFDKKAKKLLTPAVLEALYDYLALYPEKGDMIKGSGSCVGRRGKIVEEKAAACECYIIIQGICWCY